MYSVRPLTVSRSRRVASREGDRRSAETRHEMQETADRARRVAGPRSGWSRLDGLHPHRFRRNRRRGTTRLDFRDPHTMALRTSMAMPCKGPNHMDFTADGRQALTACEFSGQLVVWDVPCKKVLKTIPVPQTGSMPQDVKTVNAGKPARSCVSRSSPGSNVPTTADAGNTVSAASPRSSMKHA